MNQELRYPHTRLTAHARTRMQQRGISRQALHLLLSYGRVRHDHRGGRIVFMDKAGRSTLERTEGVEALRGLGKSLNAYAVLSRDNAIITVGHRSARIRH